MKRILLFLSLAFGLMISAKAQGDTYTLVTNVADLGDESYCLLVNGTSNAMSTTQNTNNRGKATVSVVNNSITNIGSDVAVVKIEKVGSNYTLYVTNGSTTGYLYAASGSSNYLKTRAANSDKNSEATISISNNIALITFQGSNTRNVMQYNNSSSLFACYSSASQQSIQLYKLEEKDDSKQDPNLTFPQNEYSVNLGETFNAPKVTAPAGVTVTYSSSDDGVATVNPSTGVVTIQGAGVTTITATSDENNVYNSGTAYYTLTVTDPNDISTELTPSFFDHTATSYTAVTKTDSYGVGYSAVYYTNSGNFQFNTSNANGKGSGVAVYSMNSKYKIASIDIEMTTLTNTNGLNVYKSSSNFAQLTTTGNPTVSGATKVNSALIQSSTYSIAIDDYAFAVLPNATGSIVVQKITVHYVANTTSVEPAGLQFAQSTVDVTLGESFPGNELTKATTADATYTSSNTNVAEVDANSGNITLKNVIGSTTITASVPAVEGKFEAGSVAYTLNVLPAADQVLTIPEAIAAIDNGYRGTATVTGIISKIDGYNSTYNSITYWISEDGQNPNQFEVYSGKGLNGANFTAVTDIELGATVEVKGSLTLFNGTYEFSQNSQLVSYTPPVTETLGKILVTVSDGQTLDNEGTITVTQGTTFTFKATNATDWELISETIGDLEETNTDTFVFTADQLCENEQILVCASFNGSDEYFEFTLTVEAEKVYESPVTFDFVEEDYGMTRNNSGYNTNPTVITQNPISVTFDGGNNRLWSDGMRFYKDSYFIVSSLSPEHPIIDIQIEYYDASAAGSFAMDSNSEGNYDVTGSIGTWTGSAESVKFNCTVSSGNKAVKSITVTYYVEGVKISPNLSFTAATCTVTTDAENIQSELPELNNPNEVSPITYTSSETSVATVEASTGKVTLVGAGTTTIFATYAGNEKFEEQTVSYELTVIVVETIPGTQVEIDWTSNATSDVAVGGELKMETYTQDIITFIGAQGTHKNLAPRWWGVTGGGTQLRVYEGNTLTVSVPAGYTITGIELFSNSSGKLTDATTATPGTFTVEGNFGEWKPSSTPATPATRADGDETTQAVKFTFGSSVYLTGTNVYYDVVTGVDALGADQDGEAEYFTLQGVKVANPDKGIYIVRRNGKASKVVIR